MADDPAQRISDPIRMRALTHPLRLELLDVLGDGPATATECAAATGASVASCSFHLRTLAKYGFIEPAERRGREKPWKLVSPSRDIRPDSSDPASLTAFEAIARMYLEHATGSVRRYLGVLSSEPDAWIQASTMTGSSLWATIEELAELSRTLQDLAAPFASRSHDPTLRPEGSRPINLFATAHVDVAKERRSSERDR